MRKWIALHIALPVIAIVFIVVSVLIFGDEIIAPQTTAAKTQETQQQ